MSAKHAEDAAVLSVSLALGPFNDGDASLEKLLLEAALFQKTVFPWNTFDLFDCGEDFLVKTLVTCT